MTERPSEQASATNTAANAAALFATGNRSVIARQLWAIRAMVDATLASLGFPESGAPAQSAQQAAEKRDDLAVFGRKSIDSPGGENNGE